MQRDYLISEMMQVNVSSWEPVLRLVQALQVTEPEQAMEQLLREGSQLLDARVVGVYLASGGRPELEFSMASGACIEHFPQKIDSVDLVHHRAPLLWTMGARPVSSLQRAARVARLPYLATIPLGQPKAIIGLLFLSDQQNPPSTDLLQIGQILASLLTTTLQNLSQLSRLQSENKAKEKRALSAEKVREIIPEGLIRLRPDLKILELNRAAETMLGYANREVVGNPAESILVGSPALAEGLSALQQGQISCRLNDVRLYRRSGEEFPAYVRGIGVYEDGRLDLILLMIQDISESEQMRQHAESLQQRALLGEMTTTFAHEVRNPINNISTGLQLMAANLPEDDLNQRTLERLQHDCDRIEGMMNSVLSFSRPTDYTMQPLDVGLLLQRTVDRMRPKLTRAHVEAQVQIEADCPQAMGNSPALEQVFSNLINNAMQAMGTNGGGRLGVRVQSSEPAVGMPGEPGEGPAWVEVSIADTGPGIPKEYQERLFQPFFTTRKEGTGLGLAICKRIVTAHKGSIRLESFPGGTVFTVQIPAVCADREA